MSDSNYEKEDSSIWSWVPTYNPHASSLFITQMGSPLSFFVFDDIVSKQRLEKIIILYGGSVCCDKVETSSIILVKEQFKPPLKWGPCYARNFIRDCINSCELLELSSYLIPGCNESQSEGSLTESLFKEEFDFRPSPLPLTFYSKNLAIKKRADISDEMVPISHEINSELPSISNNYEVTSKPQLLTLYYKCKTPETIYGCFSKCRKKFFVLDHGLPSTSKSCISSLYRKVISEKGVDKEFDSGLVTNVGKEVTASHEVNSCIEKPTLSSSNNSDEFQDVNEGIVPDENEIVHQGSSMPPVSDSLLFLPGDKREVQTKNIENKSEENHPNSNVEMLHLNKKMDNSLDSNSLNVQISNTKLSSDNGCIENRQNEEYSCTSLGEDVALSDRQINNNKLTSDNGCKENTQNEKYSCTSLSGNAALPDRTKLAISSESVQQEMNVPSIVVTPVQDECKGLENTVETVHQITHAPSFRVTSNPTQDLPSSSGSSNNTLNKTKRCATCSCNTASSSPVKSKYFKLLDDEVAGPSSLDNEKDLTLLAPFFGLKKRKVKEIVAPVADNSIEEPIAHSTQKLPSSPEEGKSLSVPSRPKSSDEDSDEGLPNLRKWPYIKTHEVSNKHTKRAFSRREKVDILRYIVSNKAYNRLKSDALYREMEDQNICPLRTYQSLKNHFLRTLRYELHSYGFLTDRIKKKLRGEL